MANIHNFNKKRGRASALLNTSKPRLKRIHRGRRGFVGVEDEACSATGGDKCFSAGNGAWKGEVKGKLWTLDGVGFDL